MGRRPKEAKDKDIHIYECTKSLQSMVYIVFYDGIEKVISEAEYYHLHVLENRLYFVPVADIDQHFGMYKKADTYRLGANGPSDMSKRLAILKRIEPGVYEELQKFTGYHHLKFEPENSKYYIELPQEECSNKNITLGDLAREVVDGIDNPIIPKVTTFIEYDKYHYAIDQKYKHADDVKVDILRFDPTIMVANAKYFDDIDPNIFTANIRIADVWTYCTNHGIFIDDFINRDFSYEEEKKQAHEQYLALKSQYGFTD